jgi:hypothetical protein
VVNEFYDSARQVKVELLQFGGGVFGSYIEAAS